MTIFHFAFIPIAFFAVYIQSRSYELARAVEAGSAGPEETSLYANLLRIRRFMSPFIAGLTALLTALGAFVFGKSPAVPAMLLTGTWVFASLGDIFIEGSYSVTDEKKKASFYIIGMVLFIVFTFGLGLGLSLYFIFAHGLDGLTIALAVIASVLMGTLAYHTLEVDSDTFIIMLVYTVAVSVLLCGGILAAFAGDVHLAFIGIAYFLSDWFVGLRDFGKRVPALLKRHILIVILMLYYTIMLVSIDYAFTSSS